MAVLAGALPDAGRGNRGVRDFASHPGSDTRWARFLRGIRSVEPARRLLSVIHIGLLVTVLIAMTTPTVLNRSLRDSLKARCRVDLQRELNAAGSEAAYE
jgi:hypothetical protein